VLYVGQIERSRAFYALFGYSEQRTGSSGDSRWCYLQCGDFTILLAAVQPPLITVELPLLVYLWVDDIAAVLHRVQDAGFSAEHAGYPDHAPGGEARVTDPDGNVVLFGQQVAVPLEARVAPSGEPARFSLIRQAAEAASRRGGAPLHCQIGGPGGEPCANPAEVKLADPWGDTVWGCVQHVDEALIEARSSFIATEDGRGLGPFLRNRKAPA
jgi:predicted enzyme related to lactoylglutathione lyase